MIKEDNDGSWLYNEDGEKTDMALTSMGDWLQQPKLMTAAQQPLIAS